MGTQPLILVIDDDPLVAVSVRGAVPEWGVLEAETGANGIWLVRKHRAKLALVVLDIQMPHDGVMTAAQIRAEAPEIPIVPFTGSALSTAALIHLGCAPPLFKPATADAIALALHDAIGATPPPLFYDPLLVYIQQQATQSEQVIASHARLSSLRIAILASSEIWRAGLRSIVGAAGGSVRVDTTSSTVLRNVLSAMHVNLLVADASNCTNAATLANEFNLPLLVIASNLNAGYQAIAAARGVVIEPATPMVVAEAFQQLAAGNRYHDPALAEPFNGTTLTKTERAIGRLVLQGHKLESIAYTLTLQPDTLRWHLSNIYAKLGIEGLESLRHWSG